MHDEEAVSPRCSLRRSVDGFWGLKASPLMTNLRGQPPAIAPALHQQRWTAAVLDAVCKCLAGSEFKTDQIVTG